MVVSSKLRGYLYIANIGIAILALILGAGIVLFGWVTEAQVLGVLAVAWSLYNTFIGYLARLNLTPDSQ